MKFQPTFLRFILIVFIFVYNFNILYAKNTHIEETEEIEFTSFSLDINGNAGLLKWEIKNPNASYHFEVWRSVDDFSYERAVETIAITSNTTIYSFTDNNIGSFDPLTVSYKIRVVGNDGFFLYSDVIRVMPKKKGGYPIYSLVGPNPASDNLNVHCKMTDLGNASLKVVNSVGAEIYKDENIVGEGDVLLNLDVSTWAKGIYFLSLKKNDYMITHKIVIQ